VAKAKSRGIVKAKAGIEGNEVVGCGHEKRSFILVVPVKENLIVRLAGTLRGGGIIALSEDIHTGEGLSPLRNSLTSTF
jgi:hypothetical protein